MIENRKYIIQIVFILIGLIFLVKLFFIQVLDDTYSLAAEDNVVRRVVEYPFRGLIYDRNNKLVVYNSPVYDLMIVPKEIYVSDTSIFCALFDITEDQFKDKVKIARKYSTVKPSVFIKRLSNLEFARIQDQLVDYPGFYVTARTVREYPHKNLSNALGYIGEIDQPSLDRDTTKYYKSGDYIGISGLEENYEKDLRGKRGVKYNMVNVRGIEKGVFKKGEYDTLSVPGKNLVSTIDLDLQKYGERLMERKVGSVVAIEPGTGEILALISAPNYDPNLLTGRNFGKNFDVIRKDTTNPLFNRPIMADQYPPGSIFKMIQALIALEEGVIVPSTRFRCERNIINCHGAHSYEDLGGAIKNSCNPYFYKTFKRIINQGKAETQNEDSAIGMDIWLNHLRSFGLGGTLSIDLPNEKPGVIPSVGLYDRIYGKNSWNFFTVYSLSIGQGELGVSPIQMANFASIIANRGYHIIPHLIKQIGEDAKPLIHTQKNYATVDTKHFDVVVNAMERVVNSGVSGTGFRAAVPGVIVCGKTGTAENPHGEDHSVFIAFAPKDNPKIAVSVYVENQGQGARAAAGIAGLMIEKYLKRDIERTYMEDYILKGEFLY